MAKKKIVTKKINLPQLIRVVYDCDMNRSSAAHTLVHLYKKLSQAELDMVCYEEFYTRDGNSYVGVIYLSEEELSVEQIAKLAKLEIDDDMMDEEEEEES